MFELRLKNIKLVLCITPLDQELECKCSLISQPNEISRDEINAHSDTAYHIEQMH